MFSQRISQVMQAEQMLTAGPDTTVSEASRLMAARGLSAVLVVDGGTMSGIFTERDAVFRVIALDRDPRTTPLGEVMTPQPLTVHPDRSFGHGRPN